MRNREERNNSGKRIRESGFSLDRRNISVVAIGVTPGFNQLGFFVYNPYQDNELNKRCR